MPAFVFQDRLVAAEAQALVAVFAVPAGMRRRAIVRVNHVTRRATAGAIIAWMIVRTHEAEQRIMQTRLLQVQKNGIDSIQRAETTLRESARRFAGRFSSCW